MDGQEDCEGKAVIKNDKNSFVSLLFENPKESAQQKHCGLSCLLEC